MFFILSKTIGIFSSPANIIILFILFSLFLKNKRFKKISAFLSVFLFLFFTNQAIYTIFVKMWAIEITPIEKIKNYDVAIVLGGASRIELEDTNRVFLNENAGDRIIHSIQLYKEGRVKKILFTSGSAALTGLKISEASQAKKIFYKLGVPKEDLIIEDKSRNTFENALFSKTILDSCCKSQKYLLISNGIHLKRGLACFKKLGIECTPFSVDNDGAYDKSEWHMYFAPKIYVMNGWERYFHEIFGYYAYKIKDYI